MLKTRREFEKELLNVGKKRTLGQAKQEFYDEGIPKGLLKDMIDVLFIGKELGLINPKGLKACGDEFKTYMRRYRGGEEIFGEYVDGNINDFLYKLFTKKPFKTSDFEQTWYEELFKKFVKYNKNTFAARNYALKSTSDVKLLYKAVCNIKRGRYVAKKDYEEIKDRGFNRVAELMMTPEQEELSDLRDREIYRERKKLEELKNVLNLAKHEYEKTLLFNDDKFIPLDKVTREDEEKMAEFLMTEKQKKLSELREKELMTLKMEEDELVPWEPLTREEQEKLAKRMMTSKQEKLSELREKLMTLKMEEDKFIPLDKVTREDLAEALMTKTQRSLSSWRKTRIKYEKALGL